MATLEGIREGVLRARAQAAARHEDEIVRELDGVLAQIDSGETLLTTSEAAAKLGIRSVNTIKAIVHAGRIQARKVGTHYSIPLAEIERLQDDPAIAGLQATSRIHARLDAELGPEIALTDEEMRMLSDSRPGMLPWKHAVAEDTLSDEGGGKR
jgi:excisionase family DNA binding protein